MERCDRIENLDRTSTPLTTAYLFLSGNWLLILCSLSHQGPVVTVNVYILIIKHKLDVCVRL